MTEWLYFGSLHLIFTRKMCFVVQTILARGPLRAPVASPRLWLRSGIEPSKAKNVSPFHHSRETSLSLHPSTWRAFLPPRPQTMPWRPFHGDQPCAVWIPPLHGDDFIETRKGSIRASLFRGPIPIDQGDFIPLGTLTKAHAALDARHLIKDGSHSAYISRSSL